jgi:hypothetical protein
MPQTRRKTAKTATRQKNTSSARSTRKLRDLDERDPSKVRGGATNSTSGGSFGGFTISIGKINIPCV